MTDDYLAGFIDGEGCLSLALMNRKDGRRYYCGLLIVGSTNRDILERIRDYVGAGFVTVARKIKDDGPYAGRHKEVYQYQIKAAKDLLPLLRRLRPHLIIKARQADVLMEYLERIHTERIGRLYALPESELDIREALRVRLKDLNRKGV